MHDGSQRLTLYQRAVCWTLNIIEGWIMPALPHGRLRRGLLAHLDRAQARLSARTGHTQP